MSAATVWVVDLALASHAIERCVEPLEAGERDRAGRFLRPADRTRFVASHAALRVVLAEALGGTPAGIRLTAGPDGKPEVAGEAVAFNLSHSGARALIGVSSGPPIGVDVEAIRPLPDALRIARAHFAPDEAAALARLPSETVEHAFFGLWTRKEAVVKALGTGLSRPLNRFSVSVPPTPPCLLRMDEAEGSWTLASIDAGAGYAATVALRAAGVGITIRNLPAGWPDRIV